MITKNANPCSRLCIDDLCRGNLDCTLCFGSYCRDCERLTYDYGVCEQCRRENAEEDEEDYSDEDEYYPDEHLVGIDDPDDEESGKLV